MARGKVSIKEVALSAGVSKTTVSHALSGKRPVSEGTRAKISRVIEKLHYYPNYTAQSLVSKKTGILAMLYPTPLRNSNQRENVEFIFGAADKTNALGYKFLLQTGNYDQESEQMLSIIRGGHIDGVVLMDIRLRDKRIELLREENFPFVMIGRNEDYSRLNYVDIDAADAIYQAVRHLLSLGHEKIAFLGIAPEDFGFTRRSIEGYRRALGEAGISYRPERLGLCPSDETEARISMRNLMKSADFTAVVAGGDMIALGVLEALKSEGVRIPQDISLVTVGNSPLCTMAAPPLTALSVRYREMSELAVEMLVQIIDRQAVKNQILLKPELVIRESTGLQ